MNWEKGESKNEIYSYSPVHRLDFWLEMRLTVYPIALMTSFCDLGQLKRELAFWPLDIKH